MPSGRPKGSKNKIPKPAKVILEAIFANQAPQLEAMIEETRYGIEIEKTLPDGKVVTGRLNADPRGAADLVLKMGEFCVPKLQRMEVTLQQLPTEAILSELRRRASLNGAFKEGQPGESVTH